MPVYGLGHPDAEGGHLRRYARIARILRALDGIEFESLLDVGGAEGYVAHAAARILGCEAASVDLSLQASLRARELFGLPSAAVDSWRLPFADGAFDVVLCSEVIEHVENPVETLLELQRVARVAVILTTEEVHYDRAHIDAYLWKRPGWPHMERNLFHPDDLRASLPTATLRRSATASPRLRRCRGTRRSTGSPPTRRPKTCARVASASPRRSPARRSGRGRGAGTTAR
jgi:SAM-dependent methyltransferase